MRRKFGTDRVRRIICSVNSELMLLGLASSVLITFFSIYFGGHVKSLYFSLIVLFVCSLKVKVTLSGTAQRLLFAACIFCFALAFLFQVRVEGRLSPFGTDPNYEALFFYLVIISLADSLSRKAIIFPVLAQSATVFIISIFSNIKLGFMKMVRLGIFVFVVIYPLVIYSFCKLGFDSLMPASVSSDVIAGSKIQSLINRIQSQFQHIHEMQSLFAGYGSVAEHMILSPHNLMVTVFVQLGLVRYCLILLPLIFVFRRLKPDAAIAMALASFTLDIISFLPLVFIFPFLYNGSSSAISSRCLVKSRMPAANQKMGHTFVSE